MVYGREIVNVDKQYVVFGCIRVINIVKDVILSVNPYLNTNPTSMLCKDCRKDFI